MRQNIYDDRAVQAYSAGHQRTGRICCKADGDSKLTSPCRGPGIYERIP